ncbi:MULTISPECIES: hypothetical protein [Acetobacter]|uniref:hypothetical protein n=1 Tax=Acetobacter TaxID=434 RepID=UPI00376F9E83
MATHQTLKRSRVPQTLSGRAKTGFEKWQDTINESRYSDRWNAYDSDIKNIVNEYNRYLINTPNYRPLDWKIIKAMIWVETGGPDNPSWRSRPMQIGNTQDPGLKAFFLIMREAILLFLLLGKGG